MRNRGKGPAKLKGRVGKFLVELKEVSFGGERL